MLLTNLFEKKYPNDHQDNQDGKQDGDHVWRLRRARRAIFNKQILRFYGGQMEIPAEGLAATAVDSGATWFRVSLSVCCTTDAWTAASLGLGAWGVEEAEEEANC